MTVRRAEDTGLAVAVRPEHRVQFSGLFADRSRKNFGVWPDFFDDVQLVFCGFVVGRKAFHDRVIIRDDFDRVLALVLVVLAGDAQKFSPIIDVGGPVRVHRAVNDDGVDSSLVRPRDLSDISRIRRVGETFVVDDDVVAVGPFGVFVERDFSLRPFAALVDDLPFGSDALVLQSLLHRLSLEVVIVAATAGDQQNFDRGVFSADVDD